MDDEGCCPLAPGSAAQAHARPLQPGSCHHPMAAQGLHTAGEQRDRAGLCSLVIATGPEGMAGSSTLHGDEPRRGVQEMLITSRGDMQAAGPLNQQGAAASLAQTVLLGSDTPAAPITKMTSPWSLIQPHLGD